MKGGPRDRGPPVRVADELKKQGRQNERDRGKQLDQYMQTWTRSVFERIANGIADNSSFMRF